MVTKEKFQRVLELVVNDLKTEKDVLGILLFGSMALDETLGQSDIDLLVIIQGTYRKRRFIVNHVPVDITYGPLKNIERRLERTLINCIRVFKEGKILYDKKGDLKLLKRRAEAIYKAGPRNLTKNEMDLARFRLSEVLKDINEIPDPAVAVQMMNVFFEDLLGFYFSFHGNWQPKRKHIFRQLARDDPHLNHICRLFLVTGKVQDKCKLIKRVADYILKPAGGVLEEIDIRLPSQYHQDCHKCIL